MDSTSVWSSYNKYRSSGWNVIDEEDYYYTASSTDDTYSTFTSDMDDVTSYFSDVTTGIDDVSFYSTASESTTVTGYPRYGGDTTDYCSDSTLSCSDLASLSLSDTESTNSTTFNGKLCLYIHCDGRSEESVRQLYQPLFDWVDPNGHMYNVINEGNLPPGYDMCGNLGKFTFQNGSSRGTSRKNGYQGIPQPTVEIPSLAVVLFLREDALVGSERVDMASTIFEKEPWKFHHSESISRGKINAYPYNNQNYYTAGPNDPLCAIRQIHCGKQHVRFVRFTNIDTWQDQINLYSLFLGQEPEVYKPDFCMFTVTTQDEYDIQLALKKVPREITCRHSTSAALGFKVGQVGDLVPLLPNICMPISDTKWNTSDIDGNKIYLDVAKPSGDSDSGVSTAHSFSCARTSKPKKKNRKNKTPDQNDSLLSTGDESDTSSIITDLDAFMKSILQPMMDESRCNTPLSTCSFNNSIRNKNGIRTSSMSKSSSKSGSKNVRFNHVVNYLKDFSYSSETEIEDEYSFSNQTILQSVDEDDEEDRTSQVSLTIPPVVKNGYHLYYNDTDDESCYSDSGLYPDGQRRSNRHCVPCMEPPPYKPPPPPPPPPSRLTLEGLSGFYI